MKAQIESQDLYTLAQATARLRERAQRMTPEEVRHFLSVARAGLEAGKVPAYISAEIFSAALAALEADLTQPCLFFISKRSGVAGTPLQDTLRGDGGLLNFDIISQRWTTWDAEFAAARAAQGFVVREFADMAALRQSANNGELLP